MNSPDFCEILESWRDSTAETLHYDRLHEPEFKGESEWGGKKSGVHPAELGMPSAKTMVNSSGLSTCFFKTQDKSLDTCEVYETL